MNREALKTIFLRTLPIMTGYIVLGIGFGILLNQAGYGVGWAVLMCLVIFSGTMQYIGVGLMASGASVLTTIIMSLVVSARYLFYGLSLIDKYRGSGWKKAYLIFAITDETYAILCSGTIPHNMNPHNYYFAVSLINHIYWIFGCALGTLINTGFRIELKGINFALTALIVSIFVDQWKTSKEHIPAIFGIVGTVICLCIFGREKFLLPTLILLVTSLLAGRRWIDEH